MLEICGVVVARAPAGFTEALATQRKGTSQTSELDPLNNAPLNPVYPLRPAASQFGSKGAPRPPAGAALKPKRTNARYECFGYEGWSANYGWRGHRCAPPHRSVGSCNAAVKTRPCKYQHASENRVSISLIRKQTVGYTGRHMTAHERDYHLVDANQHKSYYPSICSCTSLLRLFIIKHGFNFPLRQYFI